MTEIIVAIVGRPNVGKSSLFNRLIGRKHAIVDNQPGVTRDRNYGIVEWAGNSFMLVDTGGYLPESVDLIDTAVREQVEIAIDEADIILFLTDIQTGITQTDMDIAKMLQKSTKTVLPVVNKVDNESEFYEVDQFFGLGLDKPIPVSAMRGSRTGDLLDQIIEKFKNIKPAQEHSQFINLAIIGKENVGKSSMVNTFLEQERQIVTDIPGTTRDSIDSIFKYKKRKYLLIDTAGLKKRTKIKENILFYSNLRTWRSINRADVVIFLIDAQNGITKQDVQILLEASKEKKGILIAVNKWDLVEKDHKTAKKIQTEFEEKLGILRYIPIIFVSVNEKKRLYKMIELATEIYFERQKRISTSELNNYFIPIFKSHTPPATQGKEIKINYVSQVKSKPPLFVFYSNFPDLIAEHYKRNIENRLRNKYGFKGVPLSLSFRKK